MKILRQRLTRYRGKYQQTYFNMTPAMVKTFLRKRGLLTADIHDRLRDEAGSKKIKLHRGYITFIHISYNPRNNRLYVIRCKKTFKQEYNYVWWRTENHG